VQHLSIMSVPLATLVAEVRLLNEPCLRAALATGVPTSVITATAAQSIRQESVPAYGRTCVNCGRKKYFSYANNVGDEQSLILR